VLHASAHPTSMEAMVVLGEVHATWEEAGLEDVADADSTESVEGGADAGQ